MKTSLQSLNKQKVLAEIKEISNLQENWDSYGGASVSSECVENAKKIIEKLNSQCLQPDIYPNPNGTITMDWEINNQDLSIEIGDTKYSSYWENGKTTALEEGTFENNPPKLIFDILSK